MNPKWLKNSMIYNVYPQSFKDTNADGIGDLKGIEEKLDYIKSLGCNIIWLNPIFKSPFKDAGYDITDFYKIAERYGTKDDLKSLCNAANEKGMKVILDLVAGHTSLECEWFQKSAEVERNEYSDRYIWTNNVGDLGDGTFINGYSERDGAYMKNYYYCQPALNYGFANPSPDKAWQMPIDAPACIQTRNELLNIMDYWIECGVSGYRVDMAFSLVKEDEDNRVNIKLWQDISSRFKKKHPDCLLVSEWSCPEKAVNAGFDIDFILQFYLKAYTTLLRHESGKSDRFTWVGPSYFRKEGKGDFSLFSNELIYQLNAIKGKGYLSVPTGTHDLSRVSWGRDTDDLKVIQAFLLTMPGIPLIYYGDEIGMKYIEGLKSVEGGYKRTGSRTPMQWDNNKNHGFSEADKTYIACDNSDVAPTVLNQETDTNSLLNHFRSVMQIRKKYTSLQEDGDFKVISNGYPAIYERSCEDEIIRVFINPSDREYTIPKDINGEVLIKRNAIVADDNFVINGCGYLLFKIKG